MPPACWSQESLDVLNRCFHHVVFATLLSPKYTLNCPAALDVGRRSEIDAAYQEGAEYLQSIGIESKGEVARILDIAMNPNSLFLTLRDKKRAINAHVSTLKFLGFIEQYSCYVICHN